MTTATSTPSTVTTMPTHTPKPSRNSKVCAIRLRDSLKAGDRDKGDEAVHEIGHVLDNIEHLAEHAELSAEQKADVKKDVEELFGHFDKIDQAFHGDKDQEVPYDEHAEAIDAAIERLHSHAHTETDAPAETEK